MTETADANDDSPLRIVHVLTHSRVTRGGSVQAMRLAETQRAAGHEVMVITNRRPKEPLHETFNRWQASGLEVRAFRMNRILELLRFRRFLRDFRPDIVHCHRNAALQFTYFATIGFRPYPTFITQRGTTRPMQTRLVGYIHRSRRVHCVVAVAEAVRQALIADRVDPAKIEVVYGSVDLERFDPGRADGSAVRRELGIGPGQNLVVQVGELIPKKSPHDFIRMAAVVCRERPDVTFALVGPGPKKESCARLVEELGLEGSVLLTGFRSDIPEVYAAADVAVNCSVENEGLTGAIREALAMARPVVATEVSGNPELVRHGETGLVTPPGQPERMAAAIQELLDDPERAERLGLAGRALVRELMNPDLRLARTDAAYRRAIRSRAAAST